MRLILNSLIFLLVVGTFSSCVSKKKYDELTAAKQASDQALAETQAKVADLENKNSELQSTLESEKNRLNSELTSLRNDLNSTKSQVAQVQEKLNMTEGELKKLQEEINGIFASYKESGLSLEERNGRLYVVTSPVNYRSGSYRLSRAERDALNELAETLKNNPNLKILVEGHTDNVGVKAGAPYQDNWQLSTERALGVVRELIKQGVKPEQVAAAGRGEHMPIDSNDNAEGRAKNRRTVIAPDADMSRLIKN